MAGNLAHRYDKNTSDQAFDQSNSLPTPRDSKPTDVWHQRASKQKGDATSFAPETSATDVEALITESRPNSDADLTEKGGVILSIPEEDEGETFGTYLRRLRLIYIALSGKENKQDFADMLSYTAGHIRNVEVGKKSFYDDRSLHIRLIKICVQLGIIRTIKMANRWLHLANRWAS